MNPLEVAFNKRGIRLKRFRNEYFTWLPINGDHERQHQQIEAITLPLGFAAKYAGCDGDDYHLFDLIPVIAENI